MVLPDLCSREIQGAGMTATAKIYCSAGRLFIKPINAHGSFLRNGKPVRGFATDLRPGDAVLLEDSEGVIEIIPILKVTA